jgi:hypothetical protein
VEETAHEEGRDIQKGRIQERGPQIAADGFETKVLWRRDGVRLKRLYRDHTWQTISRSAAGSAVPRSVASPEVAEHPGQYFPHTDRFTRADRADFQYVHWFLWGHTLHATWDTRDQINWTCLVNCDPTRQQQLVEESLKAAAD